MADPLSLIPEGDQYNNLRWALQILQDDFPQDYERELNDARVLGWIAEIDSGTGRDADQIRDDIVKYIIGFDAAAQVYGIDEAQFQQLILGANEGGINLGDLTATTTPTPTSPAPTSDPTPTPIVAPTAPEPTTPPPPAPAPLPEPEPGEPAPTPTPQPVDYHARIRALYPFIPTALIDAFADAWAESGDATLALAEVRASNLYESTFPGIKREDGSLRMNEAEWFATREAYSRLFSEYGLNPVVFETRFTELMEGDVSPAELAGRLGAAYEGLVNNIPQVREFYANAFGLELTDQAIFASFIDPEVGDAILARRISVAAVGGEAAARGFNIGSPFAERLAAAGVDQSAARRFFAEAEDQLPTLDTLASRFRDPDPTFDVDEFADAAIFGSAVQGRRIRRLLASESSLFTDQFGSVATDDRFAVTGLRVR